MSDWIAIGTAEDVARRRKVVVAVGGVDVLVALQDLADAGQLDAPILVGGSTAYAFGTGLLAP